MGTQLTLPKLSILMAEHALCLPCHYLEDCILKQGWRHVVDRMMMVAGAPPLVLDSGKDHINWQNTGTDGSSPNGTVLFGDWVTFQGVARSATLLSPNNSTTSPLFSLPYDTT